MNDFHCPPSKSEPQSKLLAMIAEAIISIGEFGKVELVIERGKLRYIVLNKSFDVNKLQSGELEKTVLAIE